MQGCICSCLLCHRWVTVVDIIPQQLVPHRLVIRVLDSRTNNIGVTGATTCRNLSITHYEAPQMCDWQWTGYLDN
jgi:hypothetical protein